VCIYLKVLTTEAPEEDRLLFRDCRMIFSFMASKNNLAPSQVILLLEILSSLTAVCSFKHSLMATAPSQDSLFFEILSFFEVVFFVKAYEMCSLACDIITS